MSPHATGFRLPGSITRAWVRRQGKQAGAPLAERAAHLDLAAKRESGRCRERCVDDFWTVQALGGGQHLAVGAEDLREAVAVPLLRAVHAPVGADDVMAERRHALG